ncbi:MAG: hypothetical protein U0745_19475 [Polyangia bacterium]
MSSKRFLTATLGFLSVSAGLLSSCGDSGDYAILIRINNRPSDTVSLYATAKLGDVSAMKGMDITSGLDSVGIRLPADKSGILSVDVSALGSDQCKSATGNVLIDLSKGRGQEVSVSLNALNPKLCSLIVEQTGDGTVALTPQGVSCGTGCYDYNQGASVVVRFNPTGKSYGAQAYVSSGGICDGYNDCSISLAKRVRAEVKFQARLCQEKWCWHHPLPQGNALSGLWGSSASDLWAVGDAGTALHYDGQNWSLVPATTTKNLNGVFAPGQGQAVVVGDGGTILRWNGSAFASESSGTTNNLNSVWGTASSNVYAVGDVGTIVRNSGNGWLPMLSSTTNNLYRIHGSGADNIWTVGQSGTVRSFSGSVWNTVMGPGTMSLADVWTSSANDVWAVGGTTAGDCGVFRRDGVMWKSSNDCSTGVSAVWGNSPLDVWAASGNIKTVQRFVSTDLSKALTPDILNPGSLKGYIPVYKAAWGNKEGEVYFATSDGNILRYTADAASTTAVGSTQLAGPLPFVYARGNAELAVVTGAGSTEYFLFGDGTMFSSDGRKITAPTTSTNPPALITALYDAWTAPTGELFIGGNGGYVYKYTPAGGWVSMKATTITASVYAVGGVDASDVYVGTSFGNIYRYQSGVLPTAALNMTAFSGAIQSIWARTKTEVWAAGSNGNVIKYTGTGSPATVTVPAGLTNIYAIHGPAAPSSHVWAVGAGGLILRFDGTMWSKISVSSLTTDLNTVVALSETDVWMAGDGGVVMHWDGTSVKQVAGPFGVRNLAKLHSPGGTDLWLVGEGGTIWRY